MAWIFQVLVQVAQILELCIAIVMWLGGTRAAWV